MKAIYFLKVFVALQFILNFKGTSAGFQIIFKNITCNPGKQYFRHIYCAVIEPERTHGTIHFSTQRDLGADTIAHLRIDALEKPKPLTLIDFDLSPCKFLTAQRQNNFLQILRSSFDKYGNYSCPIKKGVTYGLFNFTMNFSKIPYIRDSDVLFTIVFRMPSGSIVLKMEVGAKLQRGIQKS